MTTNREAAMLRQPRDVDAAQWVAEYIREHSSLTVAGIVGFLHSRGFTSRDIANGFASYVAATGPDLIV